MNRKENPDVTFVKTVTTYDPDFKGEVTVELWKCNQTGGIFGVDESFLEAENGTCYNPFTGEEITLDVDDMEVAVA